MPRLSCSLRPSFSVTPYQTSNPTATAAHTHHVIIVMVRYTATEIFQILYYARGEGEDISALEARYFQSQARAHDEVEVSDDDAPTLERLNRQMRQSQELLVEEPWVRTFADEYEALPQTTTKTTVSQYALLVSEANPRPRSNHSKNQSLTVRFDDHATQKPKSTPQGKCKGKDTTRSSPVRPCPLSSARLSGSKIPQRPRSIMRVGELKNILHHLGDEQITRRITNSYRDEFAAGDDNPIELRGTGDVASIFKAAEGMPDELRKSLKLHTLENWTSRSTETPWSLRHYALSCINQQTTDLDGPQILKYRYQSLIDTGLAGDLTFKQFLEF